MQTSPSETARQALRQLAQRRLPPTPDNFTRVYHEIAPTAQSTHTVLRELLAQTLSVGIVERLGYTPDLARNAQTLADGVRAAEGHDDLDGLAARLEHFWLALQIRGDEQGELQQGLLRLLHVLTANVAELVADDSWLRGQLKVVETLTTGAIDLHGLADAERSLREITFKQSALKGSLDEAKAALKSMLATFVDRLGTLAETTGDYHARISNYAKEIEQAEDLPGLSSVIANVMSDTRGIQANLQRSRDELFEARRQADQYQAKVARLEQDLAALSDRLHEDALTAVLNRRGLTRAFDVEVARCERRSAPLCLAILDIDNFKHLNDTLGHQAGDLALRHLAAVVKQAIRPTDVIARYGGEEFVILLPETDLEAAETVMTRVQRALTKRFFLHNHERVLITFSAGVAQHTRDEIEEELVARADQALYRAKQAGKNRVMVG